MGTRIVFRGEEAVVTDVIPFPSDGLYYYGIRHSEDDWDDPSTIESLVVVNRWGAIGFRKALEPSFFDENQSIVLWEGEKEVIREAMDRWLRLKEGKNETI